MTAGKTKEEKSKFRQSKDWSDLRERMIKKQKVDYVTNKHLYRTANCHHLIITDNIDVYSMINDDCYIMLNRQTHDVVHFLYRYYKTDKDIIERLKTVLEMMVEKTENQQEILHEYNSNKYNKDIEI